MVEDVSRVKLVSVDLDIQFIGEGRRGRARGQRAGPDPDGLASDVPVRSVGNDDVSVDLHELAHRGVHVHDDRPVPIDGHVFSGEGHPAFGPLRGVAPVSHEVFLDELAERGGAEVPAVHGLDVDGLEVRSVSGAGAQLEGAVACGVIVVVCAVRTGGFVQKAVFSHEEGSAAQGLAGPDGCDLVELAIERVVEPEPDGGVRGLHVVAGGHGEAVEVESGEPPNVVDPASDVRH